MTRTKKQRQRLRQRRRSRQPPSDRVLARREQRARRKRFELLIAARERKQRRLVAFLLVGIAAVVVISARFSPAVPDSEAGRANLLLVFVTGITAGGLSCLAVQGGLLATAVTQREDSDLDELRLRYVAGEIEDPRLPGHDSKPVLWFLGTKVATYTLLGAGLGSLGGLFQPSPTARAFIQIFTALFMLATALHLLRVHPIFRYVILQPPRFITRRIRRQAKGGGAFAPATLGAMTVFLPCGVTQAMMVLAINSGSPTTGAATLFTFTLATSPLFFMLGFFATKLGDIMHSRFTKFAALGIALIALLTLNAGLRLANSPVTLASIKDSIFAAAKPVPAEVASDGIQEARIQAGPGGYSPGTVSILAGKSARLIFIDAGGGCTLSLVFQGELIPVRAETTVDLPPQDPGEIRYSCAMGMYGGSIAIVDKELEV
ncbi:MAG: sulfite exporter TauE/SafE family protein [Actinomycetota bacterium]